MKNGRNYVYSFVDKELTGKNGFYTKTPCSTIDEVLKEANKEEKYRIMRYGKADTYIFIGQLQEENILNSLELQDNINKGIADFVKNSIDNGRLKGIIRKRFDRLSEEKLNKLGYYFIRSIKDWSVNENFDFTIYNVKNIRVFLTDRGKQYVDLPNTKLDYKISFIHAWELSRKGMNDIRASGLCGMTYTKFQTKVALYNLLMNHRDKGIDFLDDDFLSE